MLKPKKLNSMTTTTRIGKIALLPKAVRDQLNRRLDDHELGPQLLAWLNGLPEVRHVLDTSFEGIPISKQNLSQWRRGGFREWQARHEAFENLPEVMSEMDDLQTGDGKTIPDRLVSWLAVQYHLTAEAMLAGNDNREDKFKLLRTLCVDISALRRGDHRAGQLKLDHERWTHRLGSKDSKTTDALGDLARNPDVADCLRNPSLTAAEKRRRLLEMLGASPEPVGAAENPKPTAPVANP
jgi:hypothetical protein